MSEHKQSILCREYNVFQNYLQCNFIDVHLIIFKNKILQKFKIYINVSQIDLMLFLGTR